jgi:hypothetical protein
MPLALCLAAGPVVAQTAGGPCGCSDVKDLQNRINMAHRAIDRYREEIPGMKSTDMVDAKVAGSQDPNATNYSVLQGSVKLAQTEVQDPTAKSGTGETLGKLCHPSVSAATACLESVLQTHENVHEAACDADHRSRKLDVFHDRMVGKPLSDMANEEIAAYQAEIDDAVKRLRALPQSCRPSGWVGTIRVLQVKELNIKNFVAPTTKYSDGTTESSTDRLSRWGTVYFSSTPTAYWQTQEIATIHKVSGGLVACKGGLKTVPADKHVTNTAHSEINGTGVNTDTPTASLDFSDDHLYYYLNVFVPEVHAKVKPSGYNKSSGGCSDFNIPVDESTLIDSLVGALGNLELKGTMKPTDDYISGSEMRDLIPYKVTVPGIDVNTDAVQITWHLHKTD